MTPCAESAIRRAQTAIRRVDADQPLPAGRTNANAGHAAGVHGCPGAGAYFAAPSSSSTRGAGAASFITHCM
jgi:hypothetical protein